LSLTEQLANWSGAAIHSRPPPRCPCAGPVTPQTRHTGYGDSSVTPNRLEFDGGSALRSAEVSRSWVSSSDTKVPAELMSGLSPPAVLNALVRHSIRSGSIYATGGPSALKDLSLESRIGPRTCRSNDAGVFLIRGFWLWITMRCGEAFRTDSGDVITCGRELGHGNVHVAQTMDPVLDRLLWSGVGLNGREGRYLLYSER
jgi:hypothetical protein